MSHDPALAALAERVHLVEQDLVARTGDLRLQLRRCMYREAPVSAADRDAVERELGALATMCLRLDELRTRLAIASAGGTNDAPRERPPLRIVRPGGAR